MDKLKTLLGASALLFSSVSQATIIQVDYTGSVTSLGSAIAGDVVDLDDTVQGSFTYDSDLGPTDSLLSFSISLGSSFTANLSGGDSFSVQNDQQNGSATLPADGLGVRGDFTSTSLNGYTSGIMQFGLLKDNVDGQLWNDTLLPDLSDWAKITLADINKPDWHWMDFDLTGTENFWDDQIRWDVDSFTVADISSVPEPSILALVILGLTGIGFTRRKKSV